MASDSKYDRLLTVCLIPRVSAGDGCSPWFLVRWGLADRTTGCVGHFILFLHSTVVFLNFNHIIVFFRASAD